jgi:hypothetical protein
LPATPAIVVNCTGEDDPTPRGQRLIQGAPTAPEGTTRTDLVETLRFARELKTSIFYDLTFRKSTVAPKRYYLEEVVYWVYAGHDNHTVNLHADDFGREIGVQVAWVQFTKERLDQSEFLACEKDPYRESIVSQYLVSIYWASALRELAHRHQLLNPITWEGERGSSTNLRQQVIEENFTRGE